MENSPVILVTGASKGIGLCVTRILLTKLSARVIAFSRSRTPELEELLHSCPGSLTIREGDVTSAYAIEHAIKAAIDNYDRLDGLVLNAGTLDPLGRIAGTDSTSPAPSTPEDSISEWKAHFDVNFFSLVQTLQYAIPHLRRAEGHGRVVFVSTGAATKGYVGWGPYSASKAAANSLCRTLAAEELSIVSVSLRPGAVDTGMQASLRAKGADRMDDADYKSFIAKHESGQLVKPEDCGQVIAALAVRATPDLSGSFVSWDAEELASYRQ